MDSVYNRPGGGALKELLNFMRQTDVCGVKGGSRKRNREKSYVGKRNGSIL